MTLSNELPTAAGNVSIVFPGQEVQLTRRRRAGELTQEAPRRLRHLHVHGGQARNLPVSQWDTAGSAGRDGPLWRAHRAAHRPAPGRNATADERTNRAYEHPDPASTANTCSC